MPGNPANVTANFEQPIIYYLTPLNRASSTYFYISGLFGVAPSTVNANGGYSGVDTVYGAGPSLGIADLNQGWNAGGDYGAHTITVDGYTFNGYSRIGIVGLTWSNNEITLTGLGTALPAAGYHIHNGDKLLVVIFPPTGGALYALTTYTGPSF
jgi:hypothetical protein